VALMDTRHPVKVNPPQILKKAKQTPMLTHPNQQDLSPGTGWYAGDCPDKVQYFFHSSLCRSQLRLLSLGCSWYARSHRQFLGLLVDFNLKCIQTGCSFPGTAVSRLWFQGNTNVSFPSAQEGH